MDLKERAQTSFDVIESELRQISRWMYENPELAYQERESSLRLSAFLGRSGFRVEHPAYGMETAFVARAGSKGPELVICAEYDALPGVGQACGHNIIATAALGAGHVLRPLAEELGFRLTILGTPAEEKYGGKVDLINAGAFREAAAAMMIHPSPLNVVDPNVIAVNHLDVEFFGKAAHASAYPHLGLNALDAFVQAYVNISTLRQHILPTDKIHGIITHGGDAANVVPAYTKSTWYVRGQERGRLDELMLRVKACFEAAAEATGCRCEWTKIGHTYEDLVSNPLMTELFVSNSNSLGRPMMRGADLPPSQTGSTDMGNVSKLVPTIHPMIGIDSMPAVNHQPEFAAHTITPSGELAIRDGALGMAFTVIDLAAGNRWNDL
jgi:amidohydrolase